MLITDKFVYIHQPKTGGTFVTYVLRKLHEKPPSTKHIDRDTQARVIENDYGKLISWKKHAGCAEIPEQHRYKPIISTLRNPYEQYVSEYEFGYWKRDDFFQCYQAVPGFEQDYPSYPELGFEDFIRLYNVALCEFNMPGAPFEDIFGVLTHRFLGFYAHDKNVMAARMSDDYIGSGRYTEDLFDVRYLPIDQLNASLHCLLVEMGYRAEDLSFVLETQRILPKPVGPEFEGVDYVVAAHDTREDGRPRKPWQTYYSVKLKKLVRQKERFIFTLFPEFDV